MFIPALTGLYSPGTLQRSFPTRFGNKGIIVASDPLLLSLTLRYSTAHPVMELLLLAH